MTFTRKHCAETVKSAFWIPVLGENTKDLLSFGLDLWLFAGDVWENIIGNVERSHARIPGTRYRLHCRNDHGFDAEFSMQGGQRRGKADNRTVRVCNDKAFGETAILTLFRDQAEMVVIDLGDQGAARPRPCDSSTNC